HPQLGHTIEHRAFHPHFGTLRGEVPCPEPLPKERLEREAHSLAASPPTPEERPVILQHWVRAVMKTLPPKPAARSRLIIGHFGSSDSALAASSGWRLRRTAADRHATRCASRNLCSGGAPRRYPPSAEHRILGNTLACTSTEHWPRRAPL